MPIIVAVVCGIGIGIVIGEYDRVKLCPFGCTQQIRYGKPGITVDGMGVRFQTDPLHCLPLSIPVTVISYVQTSVATILTGITMCQIPFSGFIL